MSLILHNINKLKEIKSLLQRIPAVLYTKEKELLSGSTIGQHFRHIIEFYTCLEKGLKTGIVSYDERERNVLLENHTAYSICIIDKISHFLSWIKDDCSLSLKGNYSDNTEERTSFQSSLFRELAYALDHTVHHLAIIKIALQEEEDVIEIDENFGIAPSTIRFRKERLDYNERMKSKILGRAIHDINR